MQREQPADTKAYAVGHFSEKFLVKRDNCHPPHLVRWAGEGWGYPLEKTQHWQLLLFWALYMQATDRQQCLLYVTNWKNYNTRENEN